MKFENRSILKYPTILAINKPVDMSSYDVIRKLKKFLPRKTKIGHFGTLDPFASGLLFIALGKATKLNNYVHDSMPKSYLAKGILGVRTETGDLTVDPCDQDKTPYIHDVIAKMDKSFLDKTFKEKFKGEYLQAPHQYSATKYQGKKLHEWAREGVEIKKEPVSREIYDLDVIDYTFPYVTFLTRVSSGTYIRVLFEEMAKELGTFGTLETLNRVGIGDYSLEKALELEKIESIEDLDSVAVRPWDFLTLSNSFKIIDEKRSLLFSQGVQLGDHQFIAETSESLGWVYSNDGECLGIGEVTDKGLRVKLNFSTSS